MQTLVDTPTRERFIPRFRHTDSHRQFRTNTVYELHAAVERVITSMHARLTEPLSLEDMASIANFSPFYFTRVFRNYTGLPPVEYLYALRIQVAKRLLITTDLSVTDICFEVGYNSLGTFSTRFAKLVGVSPRQLRNLATTPCTLPPVRGDYGATAPLYTHGLTGKLTTVCPGPYFIGLFTKPIPEGQPLSCTMLRKPGTYHMPIPRDGYYYLVAMGITKAANSLESLLLETAPYYVGVSPTPLWVHRRQIHGSTDLTLRPVSLIDPPLLTVLPLLIGANITEPD